MVRISCHWRVSGQQNYVPNCLQRDFWRTNAHYGHATRSASCMGGTVGNFRHTLARKYQPVYLLYWRRTSDGLQVGLCLWNRNSIRWQHSAQEHSYTPVPPNYIPSPLVLYPQYYRRQLLVVRIFISDPSTFFEHLSNYETPYAVLQQGSATAHTNDNNSTRCLERVLRDRLIRSGLWPPRLTDLNPCNFYGCGMLKDEVYINNPNSEHNMNKLIRMWCLQCP